MENDLKAIEATWRETAQGAEKETALNPELWTAVDSGHDEELQRYAKLKRHQERLAQYILDHDPPTVKGDVTLSVAKQAHNLLDCGKKLVYLDYYRVNRWKLRHGFTCKCHLLCACCAMRRHAFQAKAHEQRIRYLLKSNPSLVPVLITKTVKDGSDLRERFAHLSDSHKQLIQQRRNAVKKDVLGLRKASVMRHVHGGAGAYEFKRGKGSGMWHPHIHEVALLDADAFEFVEVERKGKRVSVPLEFESLLAKEWWMITGDSYIVDVRRLYNEDHEGKDDLFSGVCESFKYALKMSGLEHADQVQAYRVLKERRLIFNYGSLYGVKVPDDSADAVEDDLALEPYLVAIYKYFSGSYNLEEVHFSGIVHEDWRPLSKEEKQKRRERKEASRLRAGYTRKIRDLHHQMTLEDLERKRKRRS
jgi:hypothetical protein